MKHLAWILLCLMCGCSASEQWKTAEVRAPSEILLWQVAIRALQHEGYPVGHGLDPVNRVAKSGWANDLAPFRGKGVRRRAVVGIFQSEEDPGAWLIEVRVEVEKNMDIVRPLDPGFAEWEEAPDDAVEADLILQAIRSQVAIGSGGDSITIE